LYTLEEKKLDWPMKKINTGVSSIINHVPTRHMINGGYTKQKNTYEKISSVFGYNLAKQKNAGILKTPTLFNFILFSSDTHGV
jgi:hypothetical protein